MNVKILCGECMSTATVDISRKTGYVSIECENGHREKRLIEYGEGLEL